MSAGSASATALQLLFAGVGNGAIYALIALGFNVIFKSTGALNFAQGEWVMLGGMIAAAAVAAHADVRGDLPRRCCDCCRRWPRIRNG